MKLSRFTTILKKEPSYILHNTLVNSALKVNSNKLKEFVDDIEFGKIFQLDKTDEFQMTMKRLGMIVDESLDEMSILNSRYFMFEHMSELYIMLIVTRRCNFRCAYCYEEYTNDDMSQEVFNNVKSFILQQIDQNHFKSVFISFFGGEPTLMAKEINQFMNELLLENQKLSYPAYIRAIITTNGYLLTPDMLDQFISNHIVRYQITLDGMEEEHDRSRYLASGKGTWSTIIENLKYFNNIHNKDVSVLLRSNVTPGLYKKIDEWLEYLHVNFSNSVFRIHFETAKNFGHMNDENFELLENEKDVIMDIIDRSKKWKLPLELLGFKTMPFSMVCYAARQFSYIVDFDGKVKKCTSSSLDQPYNCIGRITSKGMEIDWSMAAQWTSYDLKEECKKCSILPLCYRRKCPIGKNSYDNCSLLKQSYLKGLEYFYI